ncbi:hypothetical protein [Streptomyces sp. RKAG293]|uniref:hypothetical protein n=1 Tax=Streptomyces sp. RKAG293 TaxID=2893403 RepID=UPI002033F7B3|nr:hypothetical protein [Streptomyces sp. RKAG293]MCM2417661.1 hypothetical protein [Streptomyces sp. RKAG293]
MATDEAVPAPAETSSPEVAPFNTRERVGAGIVGALLGGAGAVSVFMTENQAGSVALIAVGGAFLLTAVNGSPLMKAKFNDYEVELGRRRRADVLAQAVDSPPDQARQALAVLEAADPNAARDPAVASANAYVYERLIMEKIRSFAVGAEVRAESRAAGTPLDALLEYPDGRIAVEVKYMREGRPLTLRQLRDHTYMLLAVPTLNALLIVTSGQLPREVDRQVAELEAAVGKPVRLVRWSDEQDDAALTAALADLRAVIAGH